MEINETTLQQWLQTRIEASGYQNLAEAIQAEQGAGPAMAVVLSGFAMDIYINGCFRMLQNISENDQREWYRQFTPSIFLVGNPQTLQQQDALDYANEHLGWKFFSLREQMDKSVFRLLKTLKTNGRFLPEPGSFRVLPEAGETGNAFRLTIAVQELSFEKYLVHLTHTLVEAGIKGVISAGDRLNVQQVETITHFEPANFLLARVHAGRRPDEALRAYTLLEKIIT